MFRKVWEALILIVIIVCMAEVALASLKPFLPTLGFVLSLMIVTFTGYLLYRFLRRRSL